MPRTAKPCEPGRRNWPFSGDKKRSAARAKLGGNRSRGLTSARCQRAAAAHRRRRKKPSGGPWGPPRVASSARPPLPDGRGTLDRKQAAPGCPRPLVAIGHCRFLRFRVRGVARQNCVLGPAAFHFFRGLAGMAANYAEYDRSASIRHGPKRVRSRESLVSGKVPLFVGWTME